MSDLLKSMYVSASGLKTQSDRMRIVAQNIANANSTAQTQGGEPYRRKTISFKNVFDKTLGVKVVKVDRYGTDKSEFGAKYEPGHPAADENGYVLTPNVKTTIEMMDMKEAQRSYEANLSAIEAAKSMTNRTLELLR